MVEPRIQPSVFDFRTNMRKITTKLIYSSPVTMVTKSYIIKLKKKKRKKGYYAMGYIRVP